MVLASYVESSRRCKDERAGLPQLKALHFRIFGVCLCCVFGAALFFFFAGRDGRGERKTREGETQERGENVAGLGIFGVCFLGELSWLLNA